MIGRIFIVFMLVAALGGCHSFHQGTVTIESEDTELDQSTKKDLPVIMGLFAKWSARFNLVIDKESREEEDELEDECQWVISLRGPRDIGLFSMTVTLIKKPEALEIQIQQYNPGFSMTKELERFYKILKKDCEDSFPGRVQFVGIDP